MKNILIGALVGAILVLAGVYVSGLVGGNQSSLGAIGTRFPNGLAVGSTASVTANKMTIGNSGTAVGNLLFGSCNASFVTQDGALESTNTLTASSTGQFLCSVTGALSGDNVFISLPIGAGPGSEAGVSGAGSGGIAGAGSVNYTGFLLVGAYATTSNVIGFDIMNLTGAATSSFSQATTSVKYLIVR